MKNKDVIQEYQCCGCMCGGDISCFEPNENGGVGCGKHYAGTMISNIGKIYLGLPKGFNRLGEHKSMVPNIFETYVDCDWDYKTWNIPVWKHKNEKGHTLVRGLMPRRNEPFLHIFLEDCLDKIECREISLDEVNAMD